MNASIKPCRAGVLQKVLQLMNCLVRMRRVHRQLRNARATDVIMGGVELRIRNHVNPRGSARTTCVISTAQLHSSQQVARCHLLRLFAIGRAVPPKHAAGDTPPDAIGSSHLRLSPVPKELACLQAP